MARIVTVYHSRVEPFQPVDMSCIRWLQISSALARRGHSGDIATNEAGDGDLAPVEMAPQLRRVRCAHPLDAVRRRQTLFHIGSRHSSDTADGPPLHHSKLGSVWRRGTTRDLLYAATARTYTRRRRGSRGSPIRDAAERAASELAGVLRPTSELLLVRAPPSATFRSRCTTPSPQTASRDASSPATCRSHAHRGKPRLVDSSTPWGASSTPTASASSCWGGDGDGWTAGTSTTSNRAVRRSWDYLHFANVASSSRADPDAQQRAPRSSLPAR